MKKTLRSLLALSCLVPFVIPMTTEARPTSYPGGIGVMTMNDGDQNALHTHYSFSAKDAVSLSNEYQRDDAYWVHALNWYHLWRINYPDSQFNFYTRLGAGITDESDDIAPAALAGITADWENRRYLVSYENKVTVSDPEDTAFEQKARVGVAPYIGAYGDLHTWLMLEVSHMPERDDNFTVTPLVRLFKDTNLVEFGVSNKGTVLFNFTKQF